MPQGPPKHTFSRTRPPVTLNSNQEETLNVINLSTHTLMEMEIKVLSKVLSFCPNQDIDNQDDCH